MVRWQPLESFSSESLRDLKEIDSVDSLHTYAIKFVALLLGSIELETVKLYTLDGKCALALFHYQREATSCISASFIRYINDRNGYWELLKLIEMRRNRLMMLDGRCFHSQYIQSAHYNPAFRVNQVLYLSQKKKVV